MSKTPLTAWKKTILGGRRSYSGLFFGFSGPARRAGEISHWHQALQWPDINWSGLNCCLSAKANRADLFLHAVAVTLSPCVPALLFRQTKLGFDDEGVLRRQVRSRAYSITEGGKEADLLPLCAEYCCAAEIPCKDRIPHFDFCATRPSTNIRSTFSCAETYENVSLQ